MRLGSLFLLFSSSYRSQRSCASYGIHRKCVLDLSVSFCVLDWTSWISLFLIRRVVRLRRKCVWDLSFLSHRNVVIHRIRRGTFLFLAIATFLSIVSVVSFLSIVRHMSFAFVVNVSGTFVFFFTQSSYPSYRPSCVVRPLFCSYCFTSFLVVVVTWKHISVMMLSPTFLGRFRSHMLYLFASLSPSTVAVFLCHFALLVRKNGFDNCSVTVLVFYW